MGFRGGIVDVLGDVGWIVVGFRGGIAVVGFRDVISWCDWLTWLDFVVDLRWIVDVVGFRGVISWCDFVDVVVGFRGWILLT